MNPMNTCDLPRQAEMIMHIWEETGSFLLRTPFLSFPAQEKENSNIPGDWLGEEEKAGQMLLQMPQNNPAEVQFDSNALYFYLTWGVLQSLLYGIQPIFTDSAVDITLTFDLSFLSEESHLAHHGNGPNNS